LIRCLIKMNWKSTGRKRSCCILSYYSTIDFQRLWQTKKRVRITILRGKMLTRNLLNTQWECAPLDFRFRRTVLLDKPVVAQLVKKFPQQRLTKYLQDPATGPLSESVYSTRHHRIQHGNSVNILATPSSERPRILGSIPGWTSTSLQRHGLALSTNQSYPVGIKSHFPEIRESDEQFKYAYSYASTPHTCSLTSRFFKHTHTLIFTFTTMAFRSYSSCFTPRKPTAVRKHNFHKRYKSTLITTFSAS
jgi:hypothetical protein